MSDSITEALTKLYEQRGHLTASAVVEDARPATSPLHEHFEWNNKVAGHEYRLIQARRLIRIHPIKVQGKEQKLIHVPAIEPREHKEGRYVTIEELEKDDADFDRAYAAADSALQAALRRVNELRSLAKKDEKGKWQSIAKMIETARLALVA